MDFQKSILRAFESLALGLKYLVRANAWLLGTLDLSEEGPPDLPQGFGVPIIQPDANRNLTRRRAALNREVVYVAPKNNGIVGHVHVNGNGPAQVVDNPIGRHGASL